ncbi:hypothetical protein [Trichocoleus sp. FACHB-90]|nr:hypothetical protein [Trichocoleus sp. FACHB-90]
MAITHPLVEAVLLQVVIPLTTYPMVATRLLVTISSLSSVAVPTP